MDASTFNLLREMIAPTADPDLGLTRLETIVAANPKLLTDPELLRRAAYIAGASRALSASLTQHPDLITPQSSPGSVPLRLRSALIEIAGDDLLGDASVDSATLRFSDAIDDIVADQLEAARVFVSERHALASDLSFAVIAMGKWGARELNYYSDIDLVFVHDPVPGEEVASRAAAIALAARLISVLSSPTFEGSAIQVDADLRPEGAMGPLSRSLESYQAYYQRWGEPWELQALLKARFVAGDQSLGSKFHQLADQVVWDTGLDVDALRSIRLLKAQVESEASPRDIKRAPGGIRDIEFAVQILQLVHGRFDPDLRVRSTLEAIAALGAHGYIEESEAADLADAYRFLRSLEHRIQIWDLMQTQDLPTSPTERERLGRSLGLGPDPVAGLDQRLTQVRASVRDLHERLYFRPILDSLVGVASALIDPEQARLRLAALGFADPAAASRALEDLTGGLSRRSRAMQQVLPLLLDWLSQSPDPDLGLSQLRLLLANAPDHSALVTVLQSSPLAGERLCSLLGHSRLLGDLIDRIPEFIPKLADPEPNWEIRDAQGATDRIVGLLQSRPDFDAQIGTIRRSIRRRKLRIAARDILDGVDVELTLGSLSDSADAAIQGALYALGGGAGFGVIAMGKWGGRELSYGSDLDLMYVYGSEPDKGSATRLAVDLGRVLSEPGRHGDGYLLDAELRPEGRRGPLVRSIEGFRRYYQEWVQPWEILALVRARPVAGEAHTLEDFQSLLDQVVWRPDLDPQFARDIRQIKARIESERIPAGEDPDFHLKLGRGGLSDIEFVTQMLQLKHGGSEPDLRVSGTLEALRSLRDHDFISESDFEALYEGYRFLSGLRLRLHLQGGRASDSLPSEPAPLARLATASGYGRAGELREDYRRHTRKARRAFETLFYE